MFHQLKNVESAFRHIRLFSLVWLGVCSGITIYTLAECNQQLRLAQGRVYILAGGKVLEALGTDRRENLPVELRDHIKTFHSLFYTLSPDEKSIESNMKKAMYLADNSASKLYGDLRESGYYSGIISGNVSQQIAADSITLDLSVYPYSFRYYGRQQIIRTTVTITRSILTEGRVRAIERSDNNPHGFLIEKWQVLENRDQSIIKR